MKKILSYIILFAGIAIILWSIYTSYNIFTGKATAPEIFKTEKKVELTQKNKSQTPEDLINQALGEQLRGILPQGSIATLLNLISWSLFVCILIFAGSKIASLGISLAKS